MSQFVASGATLMCSFGTTPSPFTATSSPTVTMDGKPVGVLSDGAAMVNIQSFGMCSTLSNPAVASATAAALGVLTPQPCMPASSGSWIPEGSKVVAGSSPCLTMGCKLMCMYAGTISVVDPGQVRVLN